METIHIGTASCDELIHSSIQIRIWYNDFLTSTYFQKKINKFFFLISIVKE